MDYCYVISLFSQTCSTDASGPTLFSVAKPVSPAVTPVFDGITRSSSAVPVADSAMAFSSAVNCSDFVAPSCSSVPVPAAAPAVVLESREGGTDPPSGKGEGLCIV